MIRGESTNLRAVERTDAGTLYRLFNDVDGPRGWSVGGSPVSLAETQRRIEGWLDEERALGRPPALVIDHLDGTPLGVVLLTHDERDHRAVEVSLLAAQPEAWTERFDVDALAALIETAFDQWNYHRLTARTPVDDGHSAFAYEACGFRRDIVLREAAFFDGGYHDVALYCLLRTDRVAEQEAAGA